YKVTGVQTCALPIYLAHQDDIRVFPEGAAQGGREGPGVGADLTLIDIAFPVLVDELDRILDGEDVVLPLVVHVVDHRGQGRGLPRPGGPGDEHEPAVFHRQLLEDGRHAQLTERFVLLDRKSTRLNSGP